MKKNQPPEEYLKALYFKKNLITSQDIETFKIFDFDGLRAPVSYI